MHSYDCTTEFNVTDHERAIKILRNPFEDVLHAVVVPLLMLIGLLFNSAFIHVVRRVPSMHTATNAYLVNVSIADLIFVMMGGSVILWSRFSSFVGHDAMWLGSGFPGCFFAYFVAYLPYFASILLMTFVTVERHNAIFRPYQYIQRGRPSRIKTVVKHITASWTIGLVLAAASVLQYSKFKEICISWPEDEFFASLPTRVAYCIALPGFQVFSDLFTVIPFFFALIGNTVMYARIIIALNNRQANMFTRNNFVTKSRNMRRNQVARLLIVNETLFFLLQTPFRLTSVQNIMVHLTGEGFLTNNQYRTLLFYGRSLLFINSLINPFVYICVNAQYRRGFIETFSRQK